MISNPKEKNLKKVFVTIGKSAIIYVASMVVFVLLQKVLGRNADDAGHSLLDGLPRAFTDVFGPSVFVRNGLFYPAAAILFFLILVHLLANFLFLRPVIRCARNWRGAFFGFAFGILWFFGFLELSVVYHSTLIRSLLSSVRDLSTLTVFGVLAGVLFAARDGERSTHRESLWVIVPTAIFFALGHGAQYSLTFPGVEQGVYGPFTVLWLLASGAWIGVMYYFLAPRIRNIPGKIAFFALNTFGINWIFYTAFYNLFLDIPVLDLSLRCLFDLLGVAFGLSIYEFVRWRLNQRKTETPNSNKGTME